MGLKKPAAAAAKEENEVIDGQAEEVVETTTTEAATAEPETTQAEPETAAEPESEPETTAIATQNATTAVATTGLGGAVHEEGFADVELGFGAFPMVTLPAEGSFMMDDNELGKEFNATFMGSRLKFVYRNSDDDDAVEFSYDDPKTVPEEKRTKADGTPLKAVLDQWRAEGAEVEIKRYLECPVLIANGEHEGTMVMLSIAPASVMKFEGYRTQLKFKKLSVKDVTTTVYVGNKVTKGSNKFYPWAFKLAK